MAQKIKVKLAFDESVINIVRFTTLVKWAVAVYGVKRTEMNITDRAHFKKMSYIKFYINK